MQLLLSPLRGCRTTLRGVWTSFGTTADFINIESSDHSSVRSRAVHVTSPRWSQIRTTLPVAPHRVPRRPTRTPNACASHSKKARLRAKCASFSDDVPNIACDSGCIFLGSFPSVDKGHRSPATQIHARDTMVNAENGGGDERKEKGPREREKQQQRKGGQQKKLRYKNMN